MVQDMRVAIRKRAAKHQKEVSKKEREAKVAALSEKDRLRRNAGITKRKQIREVRLAKEETERKQRLAEAKELRDREAAEAKRKLFEEQAVAAKALKGAAKQKKTPAAQSTPATRKQQSQTRAQKQVPEVIPTLSNLRQEALTVGAMPSIGTLSLALNSCVVYADQEGISAWGDGAGEWTHPSGWVALVERLNQIYKVPGSEPMWCEEVLQGEYNVVFVASSKWKGAVDYLPPIVDRNGNTVPLDHLVFRVTRPDSDEMESGKGRFHRYKRLENLQREVYFTLHGAVNGFAPECYAAVLYPAMTICAKDGPVQLYGTIYVMRRAQLDLGTLLDDHVEETTARVDPHSMQYVDSLRKSGRRVATRMLPVVFRQARLGVLSFDAKPGNYVFGEDNKPYAIDFDSAMYSVGTQGLYYWEANLLMNLTLLSAHVRCYRHPALADGWASAVRELMIELCTHSRGERWLYEARIDTSRKFKEMAIVSPKDQKKCLEMVTVAYFVKPRGKVVTPFNATTGKAAAPLMHQMVRYCLHGSIRRADGPVDRALGV